MLHDAQRRGASAGVCGDTRAALLSTLAGQRRAGERTGCRACYARADARRQRRPRPPWW
jgi:hypothetical protein